MRFYWGTVLHDIQSCVKNCQCCKTAKGPYTDPEPPQGSIVASNPMDLLLIDFMKLDPSKNGKENVLVMTDAFSKFCVAAVTPNQKAKMVAQTNGSILTEFQLIFIVIRVRALTTT